MYILQHGNDPQEPKLRVLMYFKLNKGPRHDERISSKLTTSFLVHASVRDGVRTWQLKDFTCLNNVKSLFTFMNGFAAPALN